MALAPHWLDDVVGENRTIESLTNAILNSDEFQTLVGMAIEAGKASEKIRIEEPNRIGTLTYQQATRAFIVRCFNANKPEDFCEKSGE